MTYGLLINLFIHNDLNIFLHQNMIFEMDRLHQNMIFDV